MLACAQESIYTKAKSGKMKHKTLAQVCQQCHELYADVARSADRLSKVTISLQAHLITSSSHYKLIIKCLGFIELCKTKSAIFQSKNRVASSLTVQRR